MDNVIKLLKTEKEKILSLYREINEAIKILEGVEEKKEILDYALEKTHIDVITPLQSKTESINNNTSFMESLKNIFNEIEEKENNAIEDNIFIQEKPENKIIQIEKQKTGVDHLRSYIKEQIDKNLKYFTHEDFIFWMIHNKIPITSRNIETFKKSISSYLKKFSECEIIQYRKSENGQNKWEILKPNFFISSD
jgi:hypothetical protein